jgi:hypothetical protein
MILRDAVKSGRDVKRGLETNYSTVSYLRKYGTTFEGAISDDWEVEPEVYEVECEWQDTMWGIIPTNCGKDFNGKCLIGKRTKLTIEVLD